MTYEGEQWRVCEIELTSTATYQNPFQDVDVTAVFTGPSGRVITLLGFWDGDSTWRVRFAPTELGDWSYTISSTNESDTGLIDSGTVTCTSYAGDLDLYKHGFVKLASDGNYLVYDDGTPFLWLADTHWTFVTEERLDESNSPDYESQFKGTVDLRAEQGFNVYLCNFREAKDFTIFGSFIEYLIDSDYGLIPDIDFIQSNPDPKMAYLAEKGFAIAAGYSWAGAILQEGGPERYNLVAKYLTARYSAYSMIWTMAGEIPGYMSSEFDELVALWEEIGAATMQYDGYNHPRTAHYATQRPYPPYFQDSEWFDFALLQTGHGDFPINAGYFADYTEKFPDKPVVEGECLYDGISSNEPNGTRLVEPRIMRRPAYLGMQNGLCGYSYGALGVWELQWEADETSTWGALAWYDGLNLPGVGTLQIWKQFYESIDWYNLKPLRDEVTFSTYIDDPIVLMLFNPSYTANDDRTTIVGYYQDTSNVAADISTLTQSSYTARWFNPDDGTYSLISDNVVPVDSVWSTPVKPVSGVETKTDWILILQANQIK